MTSQEGENGGQLAWGIFMGWGQPLRGVSSPAGGGWEEEAVASELSPISGPSSVRWKLVILSHGETAANIVIKLLPPSVPQRAMIRGKP